MKTRIICCGNPFRGDDGAGLAVYRRLLKAGLPEEVEVIDGGTMGIGLAVYLDASYKLIIVDAVTGRGPAGGVDWYTVEDLDAEENIGLSGHEYGPGQVLKLWRQSQTRETDIRLLGIRVEDTGLSYGTLSSSVSEGVKRAANQILEHIGRGPHGL